MHNADQRHKTGCSPDEMGVLMKRCFEFKGLREFKR
jgi:hypothetical protein